MDGQPDAVVIGAGTSGTFVGVSRAVKKVNQMFFVFSPNLKAQFAVAEHQVPKNLRALVNAISSHRFMTHHSQTR
jgi:cysteine synthase